MSLSKPMIDLAKTTTTGPGGGSGGGGSQDNKQVLYMAAAAVATVATVTAGYMLYTRYRSSPGKDDKKPEIKQDEATSKSTLATPSQSLKDIGNQKFKSGDFGEALDNYTKAIELLDSDTDVTGEQKAQTLSMLYQNRAAVFEKLVRCKYQSM